MPTWHTTLNQHDVMTLNLNIGINHCFSCINVCQVPKEVLKTEERLPGPEGGVENRDRTFARSRGRCLKPRPKVPRDLANVNVLENNV